jgi:hypothetical protein
MDGDRSESAGRWHVVTVRRLCTAGVSLLTLLSVYMWETLFALGPVVESLIALPGIFVLVMFVLFVVAAFRLALHASRRRPASDEEPSPMTP